MSEELGMSDPAALPTFPRYRIKREAGLPDTFRTVEVQDKYYAPWTLVGTYASNDIAVQAVTRIKRDAAAKLEKMLLQITYDREAIYL